MAFSLFDSKGVPVDDQRFTWRDMVRNPISKLDDDAFTRVRALLASALEREALRFGHMASRCEAALRLPLARVGRAEQHQATLAGSLLAPDHSALEATIAFEQAAIEVTAAVARQEPDARLAQLYRQCLLEDLDHLYRFAALLDRLEGKDANNILQSYTDILPGRPTARQHRAPGDDVRVPYERARAALPTRLHVLTALAGAAQAHDCYMHAGPGFSDPLARQLYAEIASVKAQHMTRYASLLDPAETWLEQWLLHEAAECYAYYSCVEQESNRHARALWAQFLDYELGHFHLACDLFRQAGKRDPAEVIGGAFPAPLPLHSQREFVRSVLHDETGVRASGVGSVQSGDDSDATLRYRAAINADGSPSEAVAAGYKWTPGTEMSVKGTASGALAP